MNGYNTILVVILYILSISRCTLLYRLLLLALISLDKSPNEKDEKSSDKHKRKTKLHFRSRSGFR